MTAGRLRFGNDLLFSDGFFHIGSNNGVGFRRAPLFQDSAAVLGAKTCSRRRMVWDSFKRALAWL